MNVHSVAVLDVTHKASTVWFVVLFAVAFAIKLRLKTYKIV